MFYATRLAAWISGALLALGLLTSPASAQGDRGVHVVAVEQYCANLDTVYLFRLKNRGDDTLTIRGTVQRSGRMITETFSREVGRGDAVRQRVVVRQGEYGIVTFRSHGRAVVRTLAGQCRKVNPFV